ncbi:MAG: hypothetical protein AB7G28_13900 [Pirellulales bacterium]
MSHLLLLARVTEHDVSIHVNSGTHSASWALVLFCAILGLLVALNPPRRTSEIKKKE